MFFPKQCPLFLEALCASSTCPVLKFRPQDQCQSIVSISLISQTKQGSGLLRALTQIVLSQTSNTSPFWPFSQVFFSLLINSLLCLVTRVHFLTEQKIKNSHAPKISKQGLFLFLTESKPNPRVGCCQSSL